MADAIVVNSGISRINNGISHDLPSEEIKSFYNNWAQEYDKENNDFGNVSAEVSMPLVLELMAAKGAAKDIRIMDLGAGTGKVGKILGHHGYTNVDALDISSEMLEIAKKRGYYKNVFCEGLGEGDLSVPDDTYDLVVSIGVFSVGHAKASGFDQAVKMAKKGATIVFTVRCDAYKNYSFGFAKKIAELESANIWKVVEQKEVDYVLKYNDPDMRRALLFFCEKL